MSQVEELQATLEKRMKRIADTPDTDVIQLGVKEYRELLEMAQGYSQILPEWLLNSRHKGATEFVLDRGYVQLVDFMGSDLAISRAARTSYNAAWRAGRDEGSDWRLIRYLMKNRHTTPFEAVEFQFAIKAPIFVFRQWHRHRTWSYNEMSARYCELPEEFYVPKIEDIGEQSSSSKQARDQSLVDDPKKVRRLNNDRDVAERAMSQSFHIYRHLLKAGWPRELARGVLPVNTYSLMFAKVDLWNLFHFLTLRTHPHAQYEIRVYAEAILKLIEPIVPVALEHWRANRADWEYALKLIEDRKLIEHQPGE